MAAMLEIETATGTGGTFAGYWGQIGDYTESALILVPHAHGDEFEYKEGACDIE